MAGRCHNQTWLQQLLPALGRIQLSQHRLEIAKRHVLQQDEQRIRAQTYTKQFDDMIVCGNYAADRNGNVMHAGEARGRQKWRDARMRDLGRAIVPGETLAPMRATVNAAARL